jgi:hypothetical protein
VILEWRDTEPNDVVVVVDRVASDRLKCLVAFCFLTEVSNCKDERFDAFTSPNGSRQRPQMR